LSVRMPVAVEEVPGVTVLLEVSPPLIVPLPNSVPPLRVSALEERRVKVPLSVVVPAVCANVVPVPPTVKPLPLPMVKVPVLVKFPPVVNLLPLWRLKLPLLVPKFARPLPPDWLMIWALAPSV